MKLPRGVTVPQFYSTRLTASTRLGSYRITETWGPLEMEPASGGPQSSCSQAPPPRTSCMHVGLHRRRQFKFKLTPHCHVRRLLTRPAQPATLGGEGKGPQKKGSVSDHPWVTDTVIGPEHTDVQSCQACS